MRVRKSAFLCLALALFGVGCALFLHLTRRNPAAVCVRLVSYTNQGGSTEAMVLLSNNGSAPILFDTWNFTEPALKIAAETSKGWTNRVPEYETIEAIVVRPGTGAAFRIRLPPGTLRWQVSGLLQAATPRRRFLLWLIKLSPVRVANRLLRCLPPDTRVKSSVFEVPAEPSPPSACA